jgi:SAM-dependent methyltransferase
VATQIRKAASESITEEDLRIRVESLLKSLVLDPLGIPWGRYEHSPKKYSTLISGVRIDALHAHVVVEYESPKSFEKKGDYEHAIQQVKDGIVRHAQGVTERLPRYFGVALDGYKIGFVRYRVRLEDFEVSRAPLDVNRSTIARFVEAVVGLKRKALDAEELVKDFGPGSELSNKMIRAFYDKLNGKVRARTSILFRDWKRVFSQVCAYDLEKLKGLEEQYGFERGDADVEKLPFSLHSYFALLMKLLAAEVGSLYWPIMGSYLKALEDAYYSGPDRLGNQLEDLENGGLFAKLGILNFLEGNYFAWYLGEWDRKLADSIVLVVNKLSDYDPSTVELEPDKIKDLFKRLYQNLVPKKIRHDLGEYYTPDWLAELVLDEVGYTLDTFDKLREKENDPLAPLDLRVLDPACGSGTFLLLAIRRVREYVDEHWIDRRGALQRIVKNVVGFDLNPLAVMASRANYLISIGDMLREKGAEQVEIPIYLADSVLVERKTTVFGTSTYSLRTVAGKFPVPVSIVEKSTLTRMLNTMEQCVKLGYTPNEFIAQVKRESTLTEDEIIVLKDLYRDISKLEREGKNRIWLRILKNSFAPLLIGRFDYVVGNPPWINWESLPDSYREITTDLWDRYGLLRRTKGFGLGKAKRDLAMLFVTASVDRYLAESGLLGLLVPFTLFKTQAGAGFRVFLRYKSKVIKVHDLVRLRPFEDALNRTSLLMLSQGSSEFPIGCASWTKVLGADIDFESTLRQICSATERYETVLEPIDVDKPESSWSMVRPGASSAVRKMLGTSEYRAHEGANTALNGVYWIDVLSKSQDTVTIRNLATIGKKHVKEVTAPIENQMVYPLIRGRDVKMWSAQPSGHIVLPVKKDGKTIASSELKVRGMKTFAYFAEFYEDLVNRRGEPYGSLLQPYRELTRGKAEKIAPPFYMLFNVQPSLAPYKVLWKEISGEISGKGAFSVAVSAPLKDADLGSKSVIPDHKLMLVPFYEENEAHYVAAILNSPIARLIVASYTIETAISTHVLKHIKIPRFDAKNELHVHLSDLSKKAHELVSQGSTAELKRVQDEIDGKVSELYELTEQEMNEVKQSLSILTGEETEGEQGEQ